MTIEIQAGGEIERVARAVVESVLRDCDAGKAVEDAWPSDLGDAGPVVMIGSGKGSVGMARAACARLGDRLVRGLIIGPEADRRACCDRPGQLAAMAADHPLATKRCVDAATAALELAKGVGADETLVTLISGGTSAHLTLPADGIGLEDIRAVTEALLRSGATIGELNCVRKHLERLKGGGLARAAGGAGKHWSLVLSDVIGDPLDVVGSGTTAPDPTTFAEAARVLEERGLGGLRAPVDRRLARGAAGELEETATGDEAFWARVRHVVVGNNELAVRSAARELESLGFEVAESRTGVTGEAAEVGRLLADRVLSLAGQTKKCAIVWGGETTVTVGASPGLGGRSQELALSGARAIDGREGMGLIAFGTDGIDGPTDAAGGVVDASVGDRLRRSGGSFERALAKHDSYHTLERANALVRTGGTGTNVNDLMIGLTGLGGGSRGLWYA